MTIRLASAAARYDRRTATNVYVFATNGPEDVRVRNRGAVVDLSVMAPSLVGGTSVLSVDLDPDAARTIGTALLAAARVAERSGR